MLTTLPTREVEVHNVSETAEFSIKANGKAFKVLIDGLYSDKIRAVVREIWSNAFDAHIAAGIPDVAFDCHLPTVFEPWFSVRDYGVSLTHEGVMRLYTTVFESSKEDTNTQVGKLGLGSKSPFAYTDTFTVTAWLDGRKRTYSAYIGADYIPRISLMDECESDEAQGLEISFPVKNQDVHDFRNAAQRTSLGFDVLPYIIGSDQLVRTTRDVLAEGTGWKLYSTSEYGLKAHAKQGCVVYPIDSEAVVGLTSYQRSLLQSCLFIDFPIGDLEITASREGLGYDEATCKNIADRLAVIEREVIAQTEAKLLACKTYSEALLLAHRLRNSALPEPMRMAIDQIRWRGKALPSNLYVNRETLRGLDIVKYGADSMGRRRNLEKHATRGNFYVGFSRPPVVYFHAPDQSVQHALNRIQYHYLHMSGKRGSDVIIVRAAPGSMAMKRFLVAMGRPDPSEWVDVTKLPKVPKGSSVDYERKPVKVRVFDARYTDYREWKQVDVTGGVYVAMERGDLKNTKGEDVGFYSVSQLKHKLTACGAMDAAQELYVVPKSLARILKNAGWVNIFDLAEMTLDAHYDPLVARRLDSLIQLLSGDDVKKWQEFFCRWSVDAPSIPDGPANEYVQQFVALRAERASLEEFAPILALAKAVNRFDTTNNEPDLIVVDEAAMDERYPMLGVMLRHTCINTVFNYGNQIVVLDYVTLIDAPSST